MQRSAGLGRRLVAWSFPLLPLSLQVDLVPWRVETQARAQSTLTVVIARCEVFGEPPLGVKSTIVWIILFCVLVTVSTFYLGAQSTSMADLIVVTVIEVVIEVTVSVVLHLAVRDVLRNNATYRTLLTVSMFHILLWNIDRSTLSFVRVTHILSWCITSRVYFRIREK